MDPFTFGMVFVGASGGTLLAITAMGKKIRINESAVKFVLEGAKYGTILYLLKYVWVLFL
ncbi:hypothetical protein J1P26_07490 [Neobacillus sp. MM2021_6]|uniref:hypothetical protein n=1 Tax=Bacillaceae TaxID=186817 RepID=UPI0014089BF0|nr:MULTISPECIES: hypothetical protein [Bacillaceae]MBO0959576.1 hypothetical protein [Neobacillus sp. MM2021_6]NHC17126.1 hypothetical protein [Bacillus sp. MM2020_4]